MTKLNARPTVRIYTNADDFIDREMNDAEFAEHQALQNALAAEKAELEAKINQKALLLERLGITQAEADLLLS